MKYQKELGSGDFRKIPNGIGSVEHRMDLLFQGVATGELTTVEQWARAHLDHARPDVRPVRQKGVIQTGADADIVIYDPAGREQTPRLSVDPYHMNMDYSTWEKFEIDGHVDTMLSRSKVIVDDEQVPRQEGRRALPQARPVAVPCSVAPCGVRSEYVQTHPPRIPHR